MFIGMGGAGNPNPDDELRCILLYLWVWLNGEMRRGGIIKGHTVYGVCIRSMANSALTRLASRRGCAWPRPTLPPAGARIRSSPGSRTPWWTTCWYPAASCEWPEWPRATPDFQFIPVTEVNVVKLGLFKLFKLHSEQIELVCVSINRMIK